MYYAFLLIASLLFSSQFMVSKGYQIKNGKSLKASFAYSCLVGALGIFIMYIIKVITTGEFSLNFTVDSLLLVFLLSVVNISCGAAGLKALSLGDIATYTLFLMSGSMIISFVFGICFLDEVPTTCQIIGVILSVLALCLPVFFNKNRKKSQGFKFYFFCIILFLCNGLNSVISKINSIGPNIGLETVSSSDFMIYNYAMQFLLTLVMLAIMRFVANKKQTPDQNVVKIKFDKTLLACGALYAFIHGTANLLSLISAENVPAVMQFPLITGATMVFSGILGWLVHKEKLDKVQLLQIIVATVATVLFVF